MKGIEVKDLSVTFALPNRNIRAVDQVSAVFPSGKITGIIGESGCGKSVLGLAILGLLPPYANVNGTMEMDGAVLQGRRALGTVIGLVPQNPAESLNPARTVAAHLSEALLPEKLSGRERKTRSLALLETFGFSDPQRIMRSYPHELSGGMQQRVLCAIGSACSPQWILADEPTKGLDRDLRQQIQDNLLSLRKQCVESMLVITHDLPLARGLCDYLTVMYAGQVLEMGENVLKKPYHPYTQAFLNALPENGFQPLQGVAPQAGQRLAGCAFAPRCPYTTQRCHTERPQAIHTEDGRIVRCFLYE